MIDFVHLHVHSDFSLQDAAVSVTSLAGRAAELGMKALALTDHGNMFGAMEFIAACEKQKTVKPIIGCEVYVSPGSRLDKKGSESDNKFFHLVLLAANREGYFNLVKLCSFGYTEGFYYRPRIDEEILARHHGGLIALSACASGEIPRLIQAGKLDDAEKKALQYRDLFGQDEDGNPNFYLEIQDHGIPAGGLGKTDLSQKDINTAVAGIARNTGIPLVATNDVHYLAQEDYVAHDILLCIGTGKVRTETKRKKYYGDQFYFKTGDEMAALFPEYPEAIANTVRIAERCKTDVPKIDTKDLPAYLPDFEIPAGFETPSAYLRHLVSGGLEKRYAKDAADGGAAWEEIQKRAEYELGIIIQMGFTGYFLIVADFIGWSREHDIPVGPGRGSGAGSIVAYALRITDIDPLKYNLLFERFLNPERISMPDFDVDFANEGREAVMRYVIEKYGKDKTGQIITFGTLGAKAVIKDVARALGISIPESEMLTKLIPATNPNPKNPEDPSEMKITLQRAIDGVPKLKELEKDPRYTELFTLARKLEGLNRHTSIHAAGVVISKSVLHDLVPLYRDSKTGMIATQYDMNHLEKCGLVKMDFLGLKTLDVIKHTEELIHRRGNEYAGFSVAAAPENDKATFKMLCDGKSFEVFQFESDGMQNILKQAKPGKIEELIALNALYRPGPMKFIPQYIDSKNGKQEITYPDPKLEDELRETYGVIVYQEQVMQVARIIAGYSMGQADKLRRAMGKKKAEEIAREKVPFIEGAVKQGFSEEKAGDLYDMLAPFAGYGFNKSHAAAYSVVAYHTAYLKANFPAEFMAANLTNEINSADTDKLSECINESRRMGIEVEPPDINRCEKLFSVVDGKIVYGLLGIKGLGEATADEIVRCRADGPYKNFTDFLDRVDFKLAGKSAIEKLIQTGAFDGFGITREMLAGNLERAVEYVQKKKEDRLLGQANLFEDAGETDMPEFKFEEFPAIERAEKLKLEKQLIGFYFSGHPMDEYKEIWEKAVKVNLGDIENLKTGNCLLVGIIKSIRVINGKGGEMAFATLADYNGEIDVTFFARAWEKCHDHVVADKVAILRGKIDYQRDRDKFSFLADDWVSRQEVDAAIKEEEANERRWETFRNAWTYAADLKSGSIASAGKGSYTILGFLKSLREFKDKNGNEMAFGTLQDYEGDIDLVFFSRIWAECRDLLKLNEFAALKGSIDPEGDRKPEKPSFKVSSIADIAMLSRSASRKAAAGEPPPAPKNAAAEKTQPAADPVPPKNAESVESGGASSREIHIKLKPDAADNDGELLLLRDFLVENAGYCPVFIHVAVPPGEKIIRAFSGLASAEDGVLSTLNSLAAVAQAWRE